jgi:hypothetical protein
MGDLCKVILQKNFWDEYISNMTTTQTEDSIDQKIRLYSEVWL